MSALVVMGVAGCGKSTLAAELAKTLGWTLIEGDDFHPPANKAKMRSGVPLDDADRRGWLASLAHQLSRYPHGAVLACSSLKRSYRDQLRGGAANLRFVFIDIDEATARERVASRAGCDGFPASLVASQFAALEPPTDEADVLRLDGRLAPAELVRQVMQWRAGGYAGP